MDKNSSEDMQLILMHLGLRKCFNFDMRIEISPGAWVFCLYLQ